MSEKPIIWLERRKLRRKSIKKSSLSNKELGETVKW
jgi:hypothetical protein